MKKEYWYDASLKKRYKKQRIIKNIGRLSIATVLAALFIMLGTIIYQASGALKTTYISLDINLNQQQSKKVIIKDAISEALNITNEKDIDEAYKLVSFSAQFILSDIMRKNPEWINKKTRIWIPAAHTVDLLMKGDIDDTIPENLRKLKDNQIAWVRELKNKEQIEFKFNKNFFTKTDSKYPEEAGILGTVTGTLLTLFICIIISLPIGVLSAIYLEEFAKKNKITDFIEVTINNLAAVPSIVYGLLGLSILINIIELPRSAPITGGIVLAIMSFPTIIIATRSALKSIHPDIKNGALALGATRVQAVFHHVLPQSYPSILTGTIIALAQAAGETAPLLMIGMVAFISQVPADIFSPATTLPVQIFLWADNPEISFIEKTSAAICTLLIFLFIMNGTAAYLRNKLEK